MKTEQTEKVIDYMPESIDNLQWLPYQDDGEWAQMWVGFGIQDGRIVQCDCDTSGNWDYQDAEESDIETAWAKLVTESQRNSKEYDAHCAETGDDPLCAYYVQLETKKKRNWVIYFETWIGAPEHGLHVKSARGPKNEGKNRGGIYGPWDFPEYLRAFLELKKVGNRYCMAGVHSKDDMVGAGCVGDGYAKIQIEFSVPRKSTLIAADIRRAARNKQEAT